LTSWGREARTIVVDIDPAELRKFPAFGKTIDLPVESDALAFCKALLSSAPAARLEIAPWVERVQSWRRNYPACPPAYHQEQATNPYVFVEALAEASRPDDVVIMDTGCAVAWMMQGFKPKPGQRLIHDFNNTAMGYGLPAAIGAAFALGGRRPVTCVVGDGSIMMNLQELATVAHHHLPIKLFVISNEGYSMVQQTQEQWLGAKYHATSQEGGLSFPDFPKLARSFGIETIRIESNAEVGSKIAQAFASPGPILCDVVIPRQARVVPQSRFGFPIEDAEPLLPRREFLANMLIQPMPVSLSDQAKQIAGT
jgi:acetolactate synthase-1/2/3 large subunit